jgi:hypothetical protein
MGRIFHPLLFLLARCTKNELIRQIEFLRAENEILRTRVRRKFVRLNPDERNRLVKLGGDWAGRAREDRHGDGLALHRRDGRR